MYEKEVNPLTFPEKQRTDQNKCSSDVGEGVGQPLHLPRGVVMACDTVERSQYTVNVRKNLLVHEY